MKNKKIIIFLLILLVAASSLSVVSAIYYNSDSIDVVKNSTAQIYYSEPQKSTDYAYYYENSGNFAEDAYWGPWSADVTVDIDVEEMYHKLYGQKQNYTLDDFKQDLAILVENNGIKLSEMDFEEALRSCKDVKNPNCNETEMTCSLDENSTTLTISFSYAADEYGTKDRVDELTTLKNTKEMGITLDFEDIPDAGLKNDGFDEDFFIINDIPVKTELSS